MSVSPSEASTSMDAKKAREDKHISDSSSEDEVIHLLCNLITLLSANIKICLISKVILMLGMTLKKC